jgi:CheY-like chemotaxis protein/HPt (histidine-containing phosphotransfer) domain-containing protein
LLSNAIKFTPKSGDVALTFRVLSKTESHCRLRWVVSDTGIGISEQQQAQLFQSFQQADASITRKYGGTGLGLAICRQLAQLMGGDIGVNSIENEGSEFWVEVDLKLATPEEVAEFHVEEANYLSGNSFQGCRVLLTEDNEFNQLVATDILESEGISVVIANNGLQAIEALKQDQFDCVLMDMQMPEMDGLTATQEIRKTNSTLPIIAMTANASAEDQQACFEAGMNDFVTKPVIPRNLFNVLSKWLTPSALETEQEEGVVNLSPVDIHEHDDSLIEVSELIDTSILADMIGTTDKRKMVVYLHKFLESAKRGMTEIEQAYSEQEMGAFKKLGHRMKSPARTVGANHFAELCLQLEGVNEATALSDVKAMIDELQSHLLEIEEYIVKHN